MNRDYKFNPKYFNSHSVVKTNKDCLVSLHQFALDEGLKERNPWSNEIVLNLDCLEAKRKRNQPCKTMDFAFCITKPNSKDPKIVLGDFKLNVKNPTSDNPFNDSGEKINHSSEMLGYEIPYYKPKYFVFKKSHKSIAENTLRRHNLDKKLIDIAVVDAEYLYKEFF